MFAGELAPSLLLRLWTVAVVVLDGGDDDSWWSTHCFRIAVASAALVHGRDKLIQYSTTCRNIKAAFMSVTVIGEVAAAVPQYLATHDGATEVGDNSIVAQLADVTVRVPPAFHRQVAECCAVLRCGDCDLGVIQRVDARQLLAVLPRTTGGDTIGSRTFPRLVVGRRDAPPPPCPLHAAQCSISPLSLP